MSAGHDLTELSIAEAGAAMRDGSLTSTTLTEASLKKIDVLDPALDAFVTLTR
jgi:aspartyl-tRNA(Asn)/glutamyl-tRNA(Gln) amidotransferase subunit A